MEDMTNPKRLSSSLPTSLFMLVSLVLFGVAGCKAGSSKAPFGNQASSIYYTALIWHKDADQLRSFEQKAAPYFAKHGIELVASIDQLKIIEAEGHNQAGQPDEIQLIKAHRATSLSELFADPGLQSLLPWRSRGVSKMVIVESNPSVVRAFDHNAEIFAMGLFYFDDGGEDGLRLFERKSAPYFDKYGLNISHVLPAHTIMAGVGENDISKPDEVQFLTVKSQRQLEGLFSDPDFLSLVPLRSEATEEVTFFLGARRR